MERLKHKKLWIIIGMFLLLAAIIFASIIYMNRPDPDQKLTHLKKELHPQQHAKTVGKSKEQDKDETENNEEKENVTDDKQIRVAFESAMQKTIDFFSNQKTNFVAIGDSLTEGVGDTTGNGGYVGLLDDTINQNKKLATFQNYGKRGNRSDQLIERLDDPKIAASMEKADVILITIGANDIMEVLKENITNITYQAFAEERTHYEDRLHVIFDKLRDMNPDAKIYLIGFYNPFEQYFQNIDELDQIVDNWNATSEKVVDTYDDIQFIPTTDLFHNKKDLFAADNFHPNMKGYELMAKRIFSYLTN